MRREGSVDEISDGHRYRAEDLAKVGTDGCRGCSDCCRMDPVIVLDPYDIWQLQKGTGQKPEELLGENGTLSLQVIDGLIQPVLKMEKGVCLYLDEEGRCRIHDFRPGICRLYPLGRSWENGNFSYILQVGECTHRTGAKVKVKKWLQIPSLPRYEDYQRKWHAFLKRAQQFCDRSEESRTRAVRQNRNAEGLAAELRHGAHGETAGDGHGGQEAPVSSGRIRHMVCMRILEICYLSGYDTEQDFYPQFEERLQTAYAAVGFAPG